MGLRTRMPNIYNNKVQKEFRRTLRKEQTDAEKKLWYFLRNKNIAGLKIFRQYSVGPYILDFYCPEKRIAIELDGGQHNEEAEQHYDETRTKYLAENNIKVLRFWNNEVLQSTSKVLEQIFAIVAHS